jgi:putative Mn2+ efflux pump MntP
MGVNIALIFQSILMGIGLAMDAFSVSVANGLSEPGMSKRKSVFISATFGFFQAAMPLLGWFLIKTVMN